MLIAVGSVTAFGAVRQTQINVRLGTPLPCFPEGSIHLELPVEAALWIYGH